jgi:hypothetical protein
MAAHWDEYSEYLQAAAVRYDAAYQRALDGAVVG